MSMGGARGLRVLFAVAGGPRVGWGHLVRARSLARALGVPPLVAIRGSAATKRRATAGGWRVIDVRTAAQLRRLGPELLVIDDLSAAAARAWVARARETGIPVASIHDLGLGVVESDLLIDGTVAPDRRARGRVATLLGPDYAMLDPRVREQRIVRAMSPARILIALGGGSNAALAARMGEAIAARVPEADVRIASGFAKGPRRPAVAAGVRWIDATAGLLPELATAAVAVVAGGVTLYEACALGTPTIAYALNAPQQITIRQIARRGATVAARQADLVVREVERLLGDAHARRRMGRAGRQLVDGRGALRVAARLRQLAVGARAGRGRRAA